MAQFIELHCKHNGNPLYINVDSIAFIENENGRVYINFLMQRISASGNSNGKRLRVYTLHNKKAVTAD